MDGATFVGLGAAAALATLALLDATRRRPKPDEARLRAFLTALNARGGEILESDDLLLTFADQAPLAEDLGLVTGGGGWGVTVRLTAKGLRELAA